MHFVLSVKTRSGRNLSPVITDGPDKSREVSVNVAGFNGFYYTCYEIKYRIMSPCKSTFIQVTFTTSNNVQKWFLFQAIKTFWCRPGSPFYKIFTSRKCIVHVSNSEIEYILRKFFLNWWPNWIERKCRVFHDVWEKRTLGNQMMLKPFFMFSSNSTQYVLCVLINIILDIFVIACFLP